MTNKSEYRISIDKIKMFMENNNLTEPQMAQKMNISISYLNRVLRGIRNPGAKFIYGLTRVMPIKDIFSELN